MSIFNQVTQLLMKKNNYCKLRKSTWGGWGWNIIIFVLTWWTLFLVNLAYMLISNQLNSRLVELYYTPGVNEGFLVED